MASVTIGGRSYAVEVRGDVVVVDGHEYPVRLRDDGPGQLTVTAGGVPYRVQLPPASERASGMTVQVDYRPITLEYEGQMSAGPLTHAHGPGTPVARPAAAMGAVTAQIAGRILSVRVKAGDSVKRGDLLLLLEAMKMENEIRSPADGLVKEVHVAEGARVAEGDTLLVLE
ncbi:MAG: biotin/lipoyl-containing protein [Tepidiformaceae bacterium]